MTVRQISDHTLVNLAKLICTCFTRNSFMNFLVEIGAYSFQGIEEIEGGIIPNNKRYATILRKFNEADLFHSEEQLRVLRRIIDETLKNAVSGTREYDTFCKNLKNDKYDNKIENCVYDNIPNINSAVVMIRPEIKAIEKTRKNIVNDFEEMEDLNDEESVDEGEAAPAEPYDPSKINLQVKQITMDLVVKRMSATPPEIELETDFQRKAGLWTQTQKSRLIESLLLRIPLPAFYFDGSNDDRWLIVDGLQRLFTFKEFIIDQTLRLTSLEYLKDVNNCTFASLPRHMQRRIEETQLLTVIIQPGTPEDVKFNIFKRINTGGIRLEPQEIRHALYQGIPAEYVASLADLAEFKSAVVKLPTDRMVDREYVLRFLAFYSLAKDSGDQYKPDMDSFLQRFMGKIATLSDSQRREMEQAFLQSMLRAKALFGTKAFRKIGSKGEARKINKALFEAWSVSLALIDNREYKKLLLQKDQLYERFVALLADDTFNMSITTGTGGDFQVRTRFECISQLIRQVLKNEQQD